MMLGIGKSAEDRQRERERKKRGTRKYGQASYRHSRSGIISCLCGGAALAVLAGCILYAYITRGAAAGIVGGFVIFAPILSVFGIRAAIRGFAERERNYITCKIGLPADILTMLLFLAIFIGGLN